MATRLHDLISEQAATRPDDVALIFDDQPTTFAELDARITAFSDALSQRLEPGERVAVVADNHPAWVTAYYGVPRGGQVLVLLNHRLGPEQLRRSIGRVTPTVLIAGQTQIDALAEAGQIDELAPIVITVDDVQDPEPFRSRRGKAEELHGGGDEGAEQEADGSVWEAGPDDVAWLLPTSGTSGEPKFVPLTHRNLLAALTTTSSMRDFDPADRLIYSFPLCHVAGYNLVLFQSHGCAVVLLPRFEPADFVREVNQHAATNASLAPTMIHSLLDYLDDTGTSVPSIRDITYGASPITGTLLRRAIETLGADFHQGYGMTESAGIVVFLSPDDHRAGLGDRPDLLRAAGQAAATIGVRIVDDAGDPVPTGEVGEIVLSGPQVMGGYWNAPEVNAEALFVSEHLGLRDSTGSASGLAAGLETGSTAGSAGPAAGSTGPTSGATWFRTGDVGRLDDDGYLHVIDRKKDVIISGGENVSSREVEDLLAAHPDITEVAVIGVTDPEWGELVTAVVVARPGSSLAEDDVLAFGRDTIGGYQQPRRVEFVDHLPKTPSGKVRKQELRSQLAD